MGKFCKTGKRGMFLLAASVACAQFFPINTDLENTSRTKAAEEMAQITINPSVHSSFHDTDGDGYGEFQGFGTSLCWWANRVGYSDSLTDQATKAFYSMDSGLGMTIGRYNIGGGDDPSHNHITRSDSVVPGYAKDVTKISSEAEAQGFDQFDLEAGYAWNYDWNADSRQLSVLLQAAKYAGPEFLGEIFSNSPPYFMTKSGCSSGGTNGADNMKENCYHAFSKYLADVTKHLLEQGYQLSSIEPVNEPSNSWTYLSNKQEGCKMEPETLSGLYPVVNETLNKYGLGDLILAGCDYGSTSDTKSFFDKITDEAKSVIERMDIHCYSYSNSSMTYTKEKAESLGADLWMSEVDGSYTAGANAGEMNAALGLSKNISKQMNGLLPAAWILWDAVDIHVDAKNSFDKDSMTTGDYKNLDENGFWGLAVADHNNEKIIYTKKYFGMGQYSHFIRPGDTLIESSAENSNALSVSAAYRPDNGKTVVVVTNTSDKEEPCNIDLSKAEGIRENAVLKVTRTSGTLKDGENWADVSDETGTTWDFAAKSIQTVVKPDSITTYVIAEPAIQDTLKITNVPQNTEFPQDTVTPQNNEDELQNTVAPQKTVSVKKIAAKKSKITLKKGKKKTLTYLVTVSGNTSATKAQLKSLGVKVSSSKPNVAKVIKTTLAKGKIKVVVQGKKKGNAKIKVKAAKKSAVVSIQIK